MHQPRRRWLRANEKETPMASLALIVGLGMACANVPAEQWTLRVGYRITIGVRAKRCQEPFSVRILASRKAHPKTVPAPFRRHSPLGGRRG